MSDRGITCGACGAPNVPTAVVCATCGALLAAYATPTGADDEPAPAVPVAAPAPAVPPVPPPSSQALVAADEPAPVEVPAPLAAETPEAPGSAVVEDQPADATPSEVAGKIPPTEPPAAEIAPSIARPLDDEPPTGADGDSEPTAAPAPPSASAEPIETVEAELITPAVRAERPTPEWMAPTAGVAPNYPPRDAPSWTADARGQPQWSSRWEPSLESQSWSTPPERRQKAPLTGIPQIDRIWEAEPKQMLGYGIGLLIFSCVFFSMSSSVGGGGCLTSLAFFGAIAGVALAVIAGRRLLELD